MIAGSPDASSLAKWDNVVNELFTADENEDGHQRKKPYQVTFSPS